MEILLGLGMLLFFITLIGHGIWTFFAFIIRNLSDPGQQTKPIAPAASSRRKCVGCGSLYALTFKVCPICGEHAKPDTKLSPQDRLKVWQQQLEQLLADKLVTTEQFEAAQIIVQESLERITLSSSMNLVTKPEKTSPVLAPTDAESRPPDMSEFLNAEATVVRTATVVTGVAKQPTTLAPIDKPSKPGLSQSVWTDWLQAFLEKKNIRWGELLAGLLIIGSSVGLVISLWSTLRNAIPYFPALCFLGVTAAIHGAGLYTLRHWRLQTTSRGLLTIALLLVPLNFLAAIALSDQRSVTDPLYVIAVTIGVIAYGWIAWSGARELMHFGVLSLTVAILGSAIGQLIIGRQTVPDLSTGSLNALFALPLTTYAIALLKESFFAAKWRRLTNRRVESLYRLLGIACFSLAVSLGLLLWKSQAVLDTLSRLSPCLSLAAAMIVGTAVRLLPGGNIWVARPDALRRAWMQPKPFDDSERATHPAMNSRDIAATAVSLLGASLMVAAVVLAWPSPDRLIAVGVVNFIVLSWFGFATGLAPLHFPALECLALAGLIAFHQFGEAIGGAGVSSERTLIETLLLGRSGIVVSLMSLLTAAIAGALWRSARTTLAQTPLSLPQRSSGFRTTSEADIVHKPNSTEASSGGGVLSLSARGLVGHAKSYLAAAGGMAVLSLAIAGYAGFWPNLSQPSVDRSLATVVFVLFGIVGMIVNERLKRVELAWVGAVVWLGVFLHALGWNEHVRGWLEAVGLLPNRPIVVGLLAFATWSLGCAVVGRVRKRFMTPWATASGRAIVVALFAMSWKVWGDFGPHAIYLGWIAVLCFGQAHLWQSRNVFSLSQAVAFIATVLGVASFAQEQAWWVAHIDTLAAIVDVRHIHWQIAGLATACVPWVLWRRLGGKFAVLARCCDWKVDRWIPPVLVVALLAATWTGCWPLIMAQMPRFNWLPTQWRWDRLALPLIGVGGASWMLEEITRHWLFVAWRRGSRRGRVPRPVRFPWLSEVVLFVFMLMMFALPEAAWPWMTSAYWDDPKVLATVTQPYFETTSWWAVSTVALAATCGAICERRRLASFACLVTAGVSGLLLGAIQTSDGSWIAHSVIWWLTLGGMFALSCVRLSAYWAVRFGSGPQRTRMPQTSRSLHGVIGWLCLVPVLLLIVPSAEAHAMLWARFPLQLEINFMEQLLVLLMPLLLWSGWLIREARRERSTTMMFAVSHIVCLTIVLAAFVSLWLEPIGLEARMMPTFLQWMTVGAAICSLVWITLREQFKPLSPSLFGPGLLPTSISSWLWQQIWTWGSSIAVSVIVAAELLVDPAHPDRELLSACGAFVGHFGWVLLILAGGVGERSWLRISNLVGVSSLCWVLTLTAATMGLSNASSDPSWQVFHGWEFGWLSVAVVWTLNAVRHKVGRSRSGVNEIAELPMSDIQTTSSSVVLPNRRGLQSENVLCIPFVIATLMSFGTSFHLGPLAVVLCIVWLTVVRSFVLTKSRTVECAAVVDVMPTVSEKVSIAVRWAEISLAGVGLLCLREFVEFESVTWPVCGMTVVAACVTVLAIITRSQQRVAASMVSVVVASVMAWRPETGGWLQRSTSGSVTWWEAGLVAFSLAALAWQVVEVWWQLRRRERFDLVSKVSACRQGARVALGAALIFVFCGVLVHAGTGHRRLQDAHELFWNVHPLAGGLLWFGVLMTFTVSVWDRFSKTTVAGIYGSVWLGLLLVFESRALPMSERWSVWVIGLIAADVALIGAMWWASSWWLRTKGSFSVSGTALAAGDISSDAVRAATVASAISLTSNWQQRRDGAEGWLSNLQLAWAITVSCLACVAVLSFAPASLRMASVASVALLLPGLAAMACSGRRELFQRVTIWFVAITAVEFLWAWMEPQPRFDFWLQRSIRALEALGVTVFVLSVLVTRLIPVASDWRQAVSRGVMDVGSTAGLALVAVLLQEMIWFDPINGCPITGPQIAFVAIALIGLAAGLLAFALRGGADGEATERQMAGEKESGDNSPLSKWRQACVYAAEVVIALLFLHLYLSMPELFRGYLQPYWPLVVMAIAFAGVGASELCQRAGLKILSEPLQNSAALLPLIPALGFWVATSRTDYSTVLFIAGLVYVWLNLRRQSFWYVLGAALAGNVGLWSLWSEYGFELFVRPQVWLIPPAVSVLAAAQWNRQRLTDTQLAAIRYPAITLIYVSSAGEMFLTGISQSFWLPVVLMVLSVGGVLAGIMLRVRSFLYLGASFLLLSMVSMVWHAADAINHTWPWWAFGIGLGLGVLTLFGMFERKRNDMLRLLGELKSWER
ncbi:MAG: hypothetical protein NT013_27035 [Planctomycetia bacterium]|nr:hypothetical protein [Planctomycetia bacterium]